MDFTRDAVFSYVELVEKQQQQINTLIDAVKALSQSQTQFTEALERLTTAVGRLQSKVLTNGSD